MGRQHDGLEIRQLQRRFGDLVALDGLSFSVEPGQLYGFVGANGAGKTTTMRIVVGIDAPDSGEVRWQGDVPGPFLTSGPGFRAVIVDRPHRTSRLMERRP